MEYYVLNHNNKTCFNLGEGDWDLLKNEELTFDSVRKIIFRRYSNLIFGIILCKTIYRILKSNFISEDNILNIVDSKTYELYFNEYLEYIFSPKI